MNPQQLAESYFLQTQADRRHLHSFPELSFKEFKTAEFVSARLLESGFTVKSGVAKTGLVASFDTGRDGPAILLRFDMDALPIQEENKVDYCSQIPGKMHACGHDGHVAIGLTIGWMISQMKDLLTGTFHLLFQPAEEIGLGALEMVNEGVLDEIKPDHMLGVHLWSEKPLGWLGITAGAMMAASGKLDITVHGKGGHGGQPQMTNDPIVTSAQIIQQIQTIVSRNLDPLDSAVVSICTLRAGKQFNIIPSKVEMSGTVRYFTERTYGILKQQLSEICEYTGRAMGCQVDLELEVLVSATCNDPVVSGKVREAAEKLDRQLQVDLTYRTMLSEDVGVFLERVPGCFILVGAGDTNEGNRFPHHHPCFDFDERAMPLAATLLLQSCLELAE
ncbi:MAG: M20 family metallopeptidase [Anaerolineaceae bacterium]|jgi:amidohydrolase|nr:M20 family metallopeptidase [Anaerolineaceae bacterium]MDD4041922.1 M20 family metallopeptidase [Anaerolineaceae bacterium]MDD4577938.1 M20 family metallopeptidase [Anaerolineaceae bacterium]